MAGSPDRGGYPAWSRNGRELFCWRLDPTRVLMAVGYSASGDAFVQSRPRIFSRNIIPFNPTRSYDPALNGKQVAALPR